MAHNHCISHHIKRKPQCFNCFQSVIAKDNKVAEDPQCTSIIRLGSGAPLDFYMSIKLSRFISKSEDVIEFQ